MLIDEYQNFDREKRIELAAEILGVPHKRLFSILLSIVPKEHPDKLSDEDLILFHF
jgi:hypothetical protein